MKFVCDKCKTRYSIGEDRVRGKILKIRCKNCANVITVREGMDAGENRTGKSTMAVPLVDPSVLSGPAPNALTEEWYVSIDGVQTGPLTLTNAQKWVSSKPADAELHCWNEGFEDWLPVEKVSHFRGLRQRPAAAPPPRPRAKTAPPPLPEKPLFAATMASIEKDASGPTRTTGSGPQRTSAPGIPAVQAKSNGTGPRPAIPASKASAPAIPAVAKAPSIPSIAKPRVPSGAAGAKPSGPTSSGVPSIPAVTRPSGPATPKSPTPARGSASVVARGATPAAAASNRFLSSAVPQPSTPSASHSALADAFDAADNDALTAVGAVPFEDEVATRAEPAASASGRARNMFDVGAAAPAASPAPAATKTVKQALESDDDDDLAIGEVSRVVNLADLAPRRTTANGTGANAKIGNATGGVAKIGNATAGVPRVHPIGLGHTGSQPRISPSALGMNVDPSLAAAADLPGGPAANESIVARSFAQKHRRGMIALIAFSALLVAGVVGVVAWVVSKNSDEIAGGFGGMKQIDTSRPEDIIRRQQQNPTDTGSGSAATTAHVTQTKPKLTGRNSNNTVTQPEDDPFGNSLSASEIEDMAAKQNEGTKRCYMRAQKGALGFEIADLKKITVTLSVAKDGTVTDVQLSSHATDTLGTCLIARIKAWKFRASNGGTFRISLAFGG